jgi:hypothetical protein
VFAFIQAYFYRFLVDAKIYENRLGGANYELKIYSLEFRVNGAAASFVYGRMAA